MPITTTLESPLTDMTLGEPQVHGRLAMIPIMDLNATERATRDYLTLDEALKDGSVTVGEVSAHGSVPELRLTNRGDRRILLVQGEELTGAKQNRTLNITIMAPAASDIDIRSSAGRGHPRRPAEEEPGGRSITIPVSCVEQGRWSYHRRRAPASDSGSRGSSPPRPDSGDREVGPEQARDSAPERDHARGSARRPGARDAAMRRGARDAGTRPALYTHLPTARADIIDSVTKNMRMRPKSRRADQGRVWNNIRKMEREMGSASPTSASADTFDRHRESLDGYRKAFATEPGQVGAVFVVGDSFAGLDLFAHAATFDMLFPKLARSYGLDAMMDARRQGRSGDTAKEVGNMKEFARKQAETLITSLAEAKALRYPAVGEGEDVRFDGSAVVGAALEVDGVTMHLAGFRR